MDIKVKSFLCFAFAAIFVLVIRYNNFCSSFGGLWCYAPMEDIGTGIVLVLVVASMALFLVTLRSILIETKTINKYA